jgi:hypothetical protein
MINDNKHDGNPANVVQVIPSHTFTTFAIAFNIIEESQVVHRDVSREYS